MRVVSLNNPFPNGFTASELVEAEKFLEQAKEVYAAIKAGTAYIRFTTGDRNGSIARLAFDPTYSDPKPPAFGHRYAQHWDRERNREIANHYMWCLARWDGRSNKPKVTIPHREGEILLDYDGPTVWEKFDAKSAKEQLLKNPNQKDINGNVLAVNDKVLYINARYGSRMVLEEGTVVEFTVSVNSAAKTFATIIQSDNTKELSSLQYPESMVYKLKI